MTSKYPDHTIVLMDDLVVGYAEQARKRIGLSSAQFGSLVGKVDDPRYERKVDDVLEAYGDFISDAKRKLEIESMIPCFTDPAGDKWLCTDQVSRVLWIGEFHVANLRARGVLPSRRVANMTVYSPRDVLRLLDEPMAHQRTLSPLSQPFLRYIKVKRAEEKYARREQQLVGALAT